MDDTGMGAVNSTKGNLGAASTREVRQDAYKQTGVDTAEADLGLAKLGRSVRATWPLPGGRNAVQLDIGYFANVVEFNGQGIALCTDGVGSKSIIADMMEKYDTIGIDCVAMNVNDMICVGARPISMVDYLAVDQADAEMIGQIGIGLREGAARAKISISGGETAQLKDIIDGFDLVGMAIGHVALDQVLSGKEVRPGDIVIGVRSNGVHSNGLTLARKAFFENDKFTVTHKFPELELPVGDELLRPTDIYVEEALRILEEVIGVKALINITSDGLLNLARVDADVSFEIDHLLDIHPIFQLIQDNARVPDTEMFEVFNMGIGFCYIVAESAVDQTISILRQHKREAQPIGRVTAEPGKFVRIADRKRPLVGHHKTFKFDEAQRVRRAG